MRPNRLVTVLLAAAACSPGAPAVRTPSIPTGATSPSSPPAGPVLASGRFDLPAAQAFGTPGFHESLAATLRIPTGVRSTRGLQLVVRLRDASRPGITCAQEHPLSGCATVDWSDEPSRPNVPRNGVFDNSITVALATGPHTWYLSQSGVLADQPDAFSPG